MWAGLTGYMRVYPEYRESREGQDRPVGLGTLKRRASDLPLRILAAGRQTIVLLYILVLGLSFLLARRLFGPLPALVGFLLIAFDPFQIALSRVLHLDGLLASLMLLSLLAFLVYREERSRAAFVLSAVAAGLAWLTKSTGLFLVPWIILLQLIYLRSDRGEAGRQKSVIHHTGVLAAWGGMAVLVFCLLWPAMWVDPIGSLVRVFSDAIGYAQGGHESPVFFNGKIYPGGEIPDLSFYLINFLWRTTPIILLGLLALPVLFIQKQLDLRQRWALATLVLFALGFSAFMTLGLKKFDRYMMPSIAPLDLAAGIGLVWLAGYVAQFVREKSKSALIGIILLGIVSVQAVLAWRAYPYFFSYYNPLLGGGRRAADVMQIGWGEGLDQAADYINRKPNAEQLLVLAWYGSGPFSYLSKSKVTPLDVDHAWGADDWNQFNKSDYIVVYIHEWQRELPREVLERLRDLQPEYSVWINGLEYVWVYKGPGN